MKDAATTATTSDTTASTAASATDTTADVTAQGAKGQAADKGSTSQAAQTTTQTQDDVFFDPQEYERLTSNLPPEVKTQAEALRKALQGSYTKKTQAIAKNRDKIQAYENFEKDPITNMQAMAKRLGYNLTPAQAAAAVATQSTDLNSWNPQSWDEVFSKAEERIMGKIQEHLAPVFKGVQQVTAANIERQLDSIDENWRMYEDDMKAAIAEHPTLVKDVAKLYRFSVPEEVLNSRAVQTALKKLEDKGKAAAVHGSTTASRTQAAPKKPASFQDAIDNARSILAQKK